MLPFYFISLLFIKSKMILYDIFNFAHLHTFVQSFFCKKKYFVFSLLDLLLININGKFLIPKEIISMVTVRDVMVTSLQDPILSFFQMAEDSVWITQFQLQPATQPLLHMIKIQKFFILVFRKYKISSLLFSENIHATFQLRNNSLTAFRLQ